MITGHHDMQTGGLLAEQAVIKHTCNASYVSKYGLKGKPLLLRMLLVGSLDVKDSGFVFTRYNIEISNTKCRYQVVLPVLILCESCWTSAT